MMRYANVSIPNGTQAGDFCETVAKFLPSNYSVISIVISDPTYVLIGGEDRMGWTLDGYVIPRLGSGMYFAREITGTDELTRLPL
jgi:hypothetical protein